VGLYLPIILTDLDEAGRAAWARNETLIKRLARLGELTEGAAPKGSVTIPVPGGAFALPLSGIIDVAAEQARLAKSLAKLDKDIAGLNARLNNPRFIASAAEDVVIETRDLAEKAEDEAAKLRAALARLADMV
jgi:valyl-tRNA synthetase